MKTSTDNSVIRYAFGDKESIRLIAEAGFDGIDYSLFRMEPENDILNLPDDERYALACELREYAEKLGVCVPQAHAEFKFKLGEEISLDCPNYLNIIRGMEFASLLGCPQIVIHTVKCPRNNPDVDALAINREYMRSFIPYAEKYNIDIGVENLFIKDKKLDRFFGVQNTPADMNAFVDSLGSPRFKVCCDLGHAVITGTDPDFFIKGMSADRLTMLHVQDTDFKADRHWLPYMGAHDWDAFTSALAHIGYTGPMNLEVLHFYDKFPVDLLPDALKFAAQVARRLADEVETKKAAMGN